MAIKVTSVALAAKLINEECARVYLDVSEGRVQPEPINPGQYMSQRIIQRATELINDLVTVVDNRHQSDKEAMSEEIKRLAKENNYLRVFGQKGGCPYGNMMEGGGCKSGYPGCACMDDLMACMVQYEEDKVVTAIEKFQDDIGIENKVNVTLEKFPEIEVTDAPIQFN